MSKSPRRLEGIPESMSAADPQSAPESQIEDSGASDLGPPSHELAKRSATKTLIVESPTPERDALMRESSTLCLNCGEALPGAYCPSCGQKAQRLRQPVHLFLRDSFVEFFGLDGRVWRTLGVLLFKPGRLTRTYLEGRRVTYLRPLRIYLSSTLLFFVLLATLDPVGRVAQFAEDEIDSDADSVSVAQHLAHADSLLLALPQAWAAEDRRQDSLEARLETLQGTVTALEEPTEQDSIVAPTSELQALATEIDAIGQQIDGLDRANPRERFRRLARLRAESAVLATMPPDSLIVPDDLHDALGRLYTSGSATIGPDWLTRSQSAQMLQGARTNEERVRAGAQFTRDAIGNVPTVMFILLPVFALLLKGLYVRRDWYYSEHLVFGLHTHAFTFLVFSVIALVIWLGEPADWIAPASTGLIFSIPVYFLLSQKFVYGQGWIRTLVKAWILAWAYGMVLLLGLIMAVMLAALVG